MAGKNRLVAVLAVLLCIGLIEVPTVASAASAKIHGEVSEQFRRYNTQRYKRMRVGVAFKGSLAKGKCTYRNWDNPKLWNTDIVVLPYGSWSLGLRYAKNDVQFTRLQFSGQKGSGTFPNTGGAKGDYATWFKINTLGSHCESPIVMPFSGTLTY